MSNFLKFSLFQLAFALCMANTSYSQKISYDGIAKYWIIEGNRVISFTQTEKLSKSFSRIVLGEPASVDASDPFRILVFYSNAQAIAIINAEAALVGNTIDLNSLGVGEISHATRSSLGGAWFALDGIPKLLRVNKQFLHVEQTVTLPNRYAKHPVVQIAEHNGSLYVGLSNGSILVFDTYGSLEKELFFDPFTMFLLNRQSLFIVKTDSVVEYSLSNHNHMNGQYHCTCSPYIAIVGNEVACFNGKLFVFCEKIE
ncbi:MAG TPA: hypothetical protein PLV65_04685 [Tenuifilaceae bacterium]|nr:hypothetical protein [Tenuifilaceae bacterium]